jgi:beta-lactamase class D
MNKLAALLVCVLLYQCSFSQRLSKADVKFLSGKEDSLKKYSAKLIQGINAKDRFDADSMFTRVLVRALKNTGSFYYPFDSLETISKLYAPDSTFKIFTWQMMINDNVIRQHGAIQMRTYDGSLKLYPLIDKSDVTINLVDTIANNKGWIGAVYYNIVQKQSANQNYYTLIGYDENNIRSNKKIIEVLHFNNGEPTFGGRYFSFEEDSVFKTSIGRYIMEYKKTYGPKLNYDADMDMIVVEHLISESNEPKKKWTLVGDGDYEGFKWKNGKWVHVEKIFTEVTPEGKPPIPNPVRDDNGNLDENKLKGTEDIEQKPVEEKPKTVVKPKVVPKKKKGKG